MTLIPVLACLVGLAVVAQRPQVMILGTYHFANPGLDAVKVTQRDSLGAERQKEIADLVEKLAAFKPTKILVEVTPERQIALDEQFREYTSGRGTLTASETQQVGFRLAKRFGHSNLIGVDYKADMDFDRLLSFAQANGMPEIPQRMSRLIELVGKAMTEWDKQYTVSQILAIHNCPEMMRQSQQFYTGMLPVAKAPDYPGADLLAGWYRRNLVIFQNIRQGLVPGDRALVIYGSGHVYYLNQLLKDSGEVELIEARKYLPKPPVTELPGLQAVSN